MPEIRFVLRWPDGEIMTCASPSRIVREYLKAGTVLSVTELVATCASALEHASDRVEEVYGFRCTSSETQLERIRARAARYATTDTVAVLDVT